MSGNEKRLCQEALDGSGNATPQDTPEAAALQARRWYQPEPIEGGWGLEDQAERCIRDARARVYVPHRAFRSEDGRRVIFRLDVLPGCIVLPREQDGGYIDAFRGVLERLAPDLRLLDAGKPIRIERPATAPGWKPADASYRSPYGGGAA